MTCKRPILYLLYVCAHVIYFFCDDFCFIKTIYICILLLPFSVNVFCTFGYSSLAFTMRRSRMEDGSGPS